jgi:hypothetical protein
VKRLRDLTEFIRTGSFDVTTPQSPGDGVIRTVVYINGDVITTVRDAAHGSHVVDEHFLAVKARGRAARNSLRILRVGAWTLWAVISGLVAFGTTVAALPAATVVVLTSALFTAVLRGIHVANARVRMLVDLLKIVILIVLALLSTFLGRDQIAIGSAVSAVLDLILFLVLESGRSLVRARLGIAPSSYPG